MNQRRTHFLAEVGNDKYLLIMALNVLKNDKVLTTLLYTDERTIKVKQTK